MKKLCIVIAIVLLFSCKKEDTEANYHVSFTADGVNKTYTGHVLGHLDTTAGYVELTILGANAATSFDNYLGIYLNNYPGGNSIASGEYKDNVTNFTLLTTYANNGKEYEAGQTVAENAEQYNRPIANRFKVNITSLDGNTAKGTFSGDYYLEGDVQTGTKISVTNGDFFVKMQ